MVVKIMRLTEIDIKEIDLRLWAREGETANLDIPPIKVEMKEGTTNIRVKQYPVSQEARQGLARHQETINRRYTQTMHSPHNTPILAVKKSEGKYRLVQDLREVNERTVTRHPIVPNPYTLLSQIPREHAWFTTIDLKDALLVCPLAEECREWFTFEWEDLGKRRKQQLRWTCLPQGFTESPNLFGLA
ncbi:hypothetical protein HGM15179_017403 [Zosterops borbonicus]|uniref:ribonuclease H n=1 Tax=Zosterops borbonicus TaxID=364589 RepID=A0A8K1G0Z3_9PASS|nr:hypothetical protein HGM15179_017403 [Zosterops borbonicus]